MSGQSAQWIAAARVLRRTGFGTTGAAVDAVVRTGEQRYVAAILAADPASDPGAKATPVPTFAAVDRLGKSASKAERQQRNQQIRAQLTDLTTWWLRRMIAVEQPFGEKLTLCWHNHFATAATKVRNASWLLAQNEKLRRLGRGDFRALALAMLTDPAMLRWLDGEQNTATAPNENLSREFMELLTLGHGDAYTETDVREGARALTGWRIDPDGSTALRKRLHDNGVLGVTGNLDQTGFCDAVLAQPGCPRYLATRTWGQLVSDGLNTVIPYADPAYHDARPELAYAEGDVLHLDGSLGLNPALKCLAALWQRKQLAIVRGVGYPKPDHSHFRSMDIWQTASPDAPVNTGWIGRWLDATGDDPVRAVNIGSVLPPLAVGAKSAAAALPLGPDRPLATDLAAALAGLGRPDPSDGIAPAMVASSLHDERTVAAAFAPVLDPTAPDPDHDQQSAAGSAGGQAGLKNQLDLVARCIKAGVPTRVYAVSLGGFDTHPDEKGTQQAQLGILDGGKQLPEPAGRRPARA